MTNTPRYLARVRDATPLAHASVYHASRREAALEAFGRAYERGALAGATDALRDDGAPRYVLASDAGGDLLVLAGDWPAAGRTCGRLVVPRDLLALLLEDPAATAVWCDEDGGAGLAFTGHAVTVGGGPMLLVVARSARAVGEIAGVTQVEYDGARLAEGAWDADALEALLRGRDGDAVLLGPEVVGALARHVDGPGTG